eukprot:TRINITY_DN784_c0_g1_i2.p1 TRINITY_DN784_c0_g1~~TRINITY_DN784_c0_g1_i2.p1  ORF type:complete len:197 (-),score=42.27 TRINITY_DN784_c0_g1_i2:244-834(-)
MFFDQGGYKDWLRKRELIAEKDDSKFNFMAKATAQCAGIGAVGGIVSAVWHDVGVVDRSQVRAGWTRGPAYRAVGAYGVLMGGVMGFSGLFYTGSGLLLEEYNGKQNTYTNAFLQGAAAGVPPALYFRGHGAMTLASVLGLALFNTALHVGRDVLPTPRERQNKDPFTFKPGQQVPVRELWKQGAMGPKKDLEHSA